MKLWKTAFAVGSVLATRKAVAAARNIDANDLLGRVGLERRRTAADVVLTTVGLFVGGAALGAGFALLMAPKSGKELRTDIRNRAGDLKERAGRRFEQLEERVQRRSGNAVGNYEPGRQS